MLSALSAPVCPEQTGIYFCTDCESSHYLLKLKTKKNLLLLFGKCHYLPRSDGMYQKTFIQEVRF